MEQIENFSENREWDLLVCERLAEDGGKDPECKVGYERVWNQDVTGEGTITTHAPVISSEKCGDKCDADSNCKTYEYEPKMRKCGLNKQEYPDVANNASEFIFCAKGLFN